MDHIDQYWITKSLYRVNEPFPTQRNKSNVKTSASEAFISEFGLSNCS